MSDTPIPPFEFVLREYACLEDLVNAMGASWAEGKALLFSGGLRDHTRKAAPAFSGTCAAAEREYQDKPESGNRVFLKWLCRFPGIRRLYWQGRDFGGAQDIESALSQGDETLEKLLMHLIREQLLSVFFKNSGAGDELVANVRHLEKAFVKSDSMFRKQNALPILRVLLSGDKTFAFAGARHASPQDLAAALQPIADKSKSALSQAVEPLFQDEYNLDPQFEAWIIINGYHHELSLWRTRFQEGHSTDSDPDEYLDDDDRDEVILARQQPENDFARSVDGFSDRFIELLTSYPDRLGDAVAFSALMNDFFPVHRLQSYLLTALYRMDIVRAITEEDELTDQNMTRFAQRLIKDYGVKESFARWAVSMWCRCYGEAVLKKENRVSEN